MRFVPGEHFFRSLRFRLAFWNMTVLCLVGVVMLFGLRQVLALTLRSQLDRLLTEDAIEVALIYTSARGSRQEIEEHLERKAQTHTEEGWYAVILAPDDRVLARTTTLPEHVPTRGAQAQRSFIRGSNLVIQQPVRAPDLPPAMVRVGASMARLDDFISQVTQAMLFIAAGVFLVAPPLGFFLASRATRPLATILQRTPNLRPDRLKERLPLRGSGDELDRLSATINGFLDRIALYVQKQREFIANAAHELRSPLTALRAALEVALQHDRSPEEYHDLLADLAEDCAALGVLVNQMLLLAEGDAGILQPGDEVVDLTAFASRATEMFQGVAEQRGVDLRLDAADAVLVRGDPSHLRQVLYNLIDNALRYTPHGGWAHVTLTREGSHASLVVADSGIGIPPEDLPHVFDRFYRADRARSRQTAVRGTGLGLCICQSIVNAYGGSIRVQSELGKGTRVCVLLPMA